jgi:cytochrome c oxidase subunit 4
MTKSRANVYTWIALLALLAITCGSSYVPMGSLNVVVNVAVAAIKAMLVILVFMHVRTERPLIRLIAVVGVIWLAILAGLSMTDFAGRAP